MSLPLPTARAESVLDFFQPQADLHNPARPRPEIVLNVTGYPAGGVAPLGLPNGLSVIVDVKAAALPVAYGGGGRDDLLLRLRPAEILRLNGAQIARIVDDNESERSTAG